MHTIYRAIWRAHTFGAAAFSMLIRPHPQTSFSRPKSSCWKSLTLGRCCSAHRESNHVPFVAYVCGTQREIRFHMKQWMWCAETTYLINLTFMIQSVSQPQPATRWFHVSRECTYTSLFSFCLSSTNKHSEVYFTLWLLLADANRYFWHFKGWNNTWLVWKATRIHTDINHYLLYCISFYLPLTGASFSPCRSSSERRLSERNTPQACHGFRPPRTPPALRPPLSSNVSVHLY